MPNMSLKKNEMPAQLPDVRNKNFSEVALGYTKEQAIDEAKRCLNCKTNLALAVVLYVLTFLLSQPWWQRGILKRHMI